MKQIKYTLIILLIGAMFIIGCSSQESNENSADNVNVPASSDDSNILPDSANDSINNTGNDGSANELEPTVISETQLAIHNSQSDCWIGFEGKVYDITNWLPRHPGSAGAIAPYCGTANQFEFAFSSKHGTSKISKLLQEGEFKGVLE